MPANAGSPRLEIRSMVFSWGSGLVAKPSITLRGGLAVPGRMATYEFLASYRRESGLAISGHLTRLPRAIELSLMAMLPAGCKLAWAAAQGLTSTTLPNGRLPSSSLALRNMALYAPRGERAGRSVMAGRHFAMTVNLRSRTEGDLFIRVSADGQANFGRMDMAAFIRTNQVVELNQRIQTNAQACGPDMAAFGRHVLAGFGQN